MSMMCLTRIDYNDTRPVYVNMTAVATIERCDHYTRVELTNGTAVKVKEQPSAILVQMGEWDMADSAAQEPVAA